MLDITTLPPNTQIAISELETSKARNRRGIIPLSRSQARAIPTIPPHRRHARYILPSRRSQKLDRATSNPQGVKTMKPQTPQNPTPKKTTPAQTQPNHHRATHRRQHLHLYPARLLSHQKSRPSRHRRATPARLDLPHTGRQRSPAIQKNGCPTRSLKKGIAWDCFSKSPLHGVVFSNALSPFLYRSETLPPNSKKVAKGNKQQRAFFLGHKGQIYC